MKQIHELYKDDRPREKMLLKGASALKNRELIAIILGSGQRGVPVMTISRDVENMLEKQGVENMSLENLSKIEGVGKAKACQIMAVFELAKRFFTEPEKTVVSASSDVAKLLEKYSSKQQEHFIVVTLDGANNVINVRVVFIGTLNRTTVHPREVFAYALSDRAASIIIAHNHPSGNLEPSVGDILMTQKLKEAGEIIGIEIIDHIILAKKGHYSFQGNGKL
ncbi:MAG: RadC family protein [bacterium]